MDQTPTQYLEVADVCREFQVSRKTVIDWIKRGRVNAIQPGGPGGAYRIPADEIDRLKTPGSAA